MVIAFLWGLCEALFLFFIPDIWLSFIAAGTESLWRNSIRATLWVLVGGLLGACLLFWFLNARGHASYENITAFWQNLPGVYPYMFRVAGGHLQGAGAAGMLEGPTSGIPYRVYVAQAWLQHIPLVKILLWTPLARLERIVLAPLVVIAIRLSLRYFKKDYPRLLLWGLSLYWVGIYVWYWGFFLPAEALKYSY